MGSGDDEGKLYYKTIRDSICDQLHIPANKSVGMLYFLDQRKQHLFLFEGNERDRIHMQECILPINAIPRRIRKVRPQ
jgi:hypothetical protein